MKFTVKRKQIITWTYERIEANDAEEAKVYIENLPASGLSLRPDACDTKYEIEVEEGE